MEYGAPQISDTTRPTLLFRATPYTKYAALILFIVLPFIGGYIGYTYAPEKIVVVEKNIVKEPTDLTQTPTDIATKPSETRMTFTNTTYGYTFQYPQTYYLGTNDFEGATSTSPSIFIASDDLDHLAKDTKYFSVEAYSYPEMSTISQLPLQEFAERLRRINVDDRNPNVRKEVSELFETRIGGNTGFEFNLSGSYQGEFGGHILEHTHTYILTEHNGTKLIISFPADPAEYPISREIVNSFRFQ